jgi:ATP-binding cassette subfamily B protein
LVFWIFVQSIAYSSDWIGDRKSRRLSTDMNLQISVDSLSHLLKLPIAYHKRVAINGDLRKITEGSALISHAVRVLTSLVPQCLSILIGLIMTILINAPMALILIIAAVIYAIFLRRDFGSAARQDEHSRDEHVEVWAEATAAVNLVEVVKQATAEDHEIEKLRSSFLGRVQPTWQRLEVRWSNVSFTQKAITFVTQSVIFGVSIYAVSRHYLTIGELVAFNGYTMMLLGPMVSLGYSWQALQGGLTATRQLEDIFRQELEIYAPETSASLPARAEIHFDKVSFAYEGEGNLILRDLTFRVPPGTTVAIVGATGSGKSTLISLLSGYYFPTKGAVRIGGVDTRQLDLRDLRRRIAVVPQEVALFNQSIASNIRYGSFDASDKMVSAAARLARVDEFVRDLPLGYETIVGERGVMLSVGQKQRIAIARAVLRNPSIFIFDEPTSALDSQTEKLVSEALEAAMGGRTAFIVAHRLSTVRRADMILVLERGRIVESGCHDSLVRETGGLYRRFYDYHMDLQS